MKTLNGCDQRRSGATSPLGWRQGEVGEVNQIAQLGQPQRVNRTTRNVSSETSTLMSAPPLPDPGFAPSTECPISCRVCGGRRSQVPAQGKALTDNLNLQGFTVWSCVVELRVTWLSRGHVMGQIAMVTESPSGPRGLFGTWSPLIPKQCLCHPTPLVCRPLEQEMLGLEPPGP